MKWLNGFYMDNNAPQEAALISDTLYTLLLEGQSQGKQIKSDAKGLPYLADIEASEAERLQIKVQALNEWFNWYDNQVSQAQRAMRMNLAWTATYIDKQYFTIAELDAEAKIKQEELRALRNM